MMLLPWFTMGGVLRQDGNEVAHEADKDLVRDAVIHADPGDLRALKNIYGCFTHAGCRRHLCILQSSPLESDPDSSNLDCSAKAINCSRIRSYPRSWTIVGCSKFFNGALRISKVTTAPLPTGLIRTGRYRDINRIRPNILEMSAHFRRKCLLGGWICSE
jgi:hypothetical protein